MTKEAMTVAEDNCRHRWSNEDKYGNRICLECSVDMPEENEDEFGKVEPEDGLENELSFSPNYKN